MAATSPIDPVTTNNQSERAPHRTIANGSSDLLPLGWAIFRFFQLPSYLFQFRKDTTWKKKLLRHGTTSLRENVNKVMGEMQASEWVKDAAVLRITCSCLTSKTTDVIDGRSFPTIVRFHNTTTCVSFHFIPCQKHSLSFPLTRQHT